MSAFYSFGDTPLAGLLCRIISHLQGGEGGFENYILLNDKFDSLKRFFCLPNNFIDGEADILGQWLGPVGFKDLDGLLSHNLPIIFASLLFPHIGMVSVHIFWPPVFLSMKPPGLFS